jgi:alcohol dehydrogenase YqhD (iron-dependent ADH family)
VFGSAFSFLVQVIRISSAIVRDLHDGRSSRIRSLLLRAVLADIGPVVLTAGSPIELRERVTFAVSFALNLMFTLGGESCWAIT